MNKTPKLRFKEFSGDWESKKLGTICDVTMGQSPSSSCYNERNIGLPLIQGNADVQGRKTAPRIYTSDITKTCNIGDIIMSVRAPVGAISKSIHDACIGRGVCSIKPKQSNEFIYQFLIKYEDKWSRISQGSTFESVNRTDITDTKVSIPSKEEQEEIASFFSLIDDKISLQGEKVEALKDYKKGMMQKIFSRELRFKDDDGRDYPEWEEKKLGDITDIGTGSNDLQDKVEGGLYPFFVRSANIERINTYTFDGEAILIPGDGNIGQIYHYINGKFAYHQRVYKISDFINGVSGKYIYYYMSRFFLKEALKNSVKATVDSLRLPTLTGMHIVLPCIEEQEKITMLLSNLENKVEKEQEKLDSLNEYKKGLLQQMFI